MKKRIPTFVFLSAVAFSLNGASAATIYDEAVDGDLDAIGSTFVNLALGANDILGRIPGTPPADSDRVKIVQTAGLFVDSIILQFTSAFDPLSLGTQFNLALFNDQANLFDDNFNIASSGAPIAASFFDSFGPDTGPLAQGVDGAVWDFQISPGTVYPYQDWKLTINTSAKPLPPVPPIPVPAGLPMLLGGLCLLAGFGFRARRR